MDVDGDFSLLQPVDLITKDVSELRQILKDKKEKEREREREAEKEKEREKEREVQFRI